jgi:hypothetical protein
MTVTSMRERSYADFDGVVAFLADNVSDYLYAGTDQEIWGADDFPNVAPPFPKMWFESEFPDEIVSRVYGVKKIDKKEVGIARIGMLLDAVKVSDIVANDPGRFATLADHKAQLEKRIAELRVHLERDGSLMDKVRAVIPAGKILDREDLERLSKVVPMGFAMGIADVQKLSLAIKYGEEMSSGDMIKDMSEFGTEWLLCGSVFSRIDRHVVGPLCGFTAMVDKHGRFVQNRSSGFLSLSIQHGDNMRAEDRYSLVDGCSSKLFPFWLALSFMHCKNVKVTTLEQPRKKKAHKRDDAYRPLVYRTLQIEPMKKVISEEGGVSHNGMQKALHICRGHFKDYSKGMGLFGKYKGVYWWPDLVRGHSDNGIVAKDYAVNA